MKGTAHILAALLLWLCSGVLRAEVYTIDFNRGTVSGTYIRTSVKGVATATLCTAGADFFALHANTRACFYNSEGCGIRIGEASGTGQAPFIMTLCDAIQNEDIVRVVVYASRGTTDNNASFKVYAANDVIGEIDFSEMKDYDPTHPESTVYVLPAIDLQKRFKNLMVEARNTNYVILHRIDIYTSDGSEDGICSPMISFDEMGVFCNLAGQRTSNPSHGIYIKGGKKYVVR